MVFECSAEVDAEPSSVFALTQDYGRRLAWDPFLTRAELVAPATAPGVGVRAYCAAYFGVGMETEYVSFEPPRVAAMRMTCGPWFLERFAGSWRFRAVAPGRTRVTFRYRLEARPRWAARVLTLVLGWVFARESRARLAALRAAVAGRVARL